MLPDWFTPALGSLACLVSLTACVQKVDKRLKLTVLLAMCLWAPYYWLKGGTSGFAFALLIGVRQVLALNTHRLSPRMQRASLVALVVAMTATVWLTWEGWTSLLPWFATVNSTYAYLKFQGVRLRLQIVAGDAAWAVYAIAMTAWPHLVFMLVAIGLNLWTDRLRQAGLSAQAKAGVST